MAGKAKVEKIDIIERVSAQSVLKHTGKDWNQWLDILDSAGAKKWQRKDILGFLKEKYRLTPWWQQGVTRGYEIARGRVMPGRNAKGQYSITVTKTVPVSVKTLWKFLNSPAGIALWLQPLSPLRVAPKMSFETENGIFGEIRTIKKERWIRFSWQETEWVKPTVVQLITVARPKNKCLFAFMHENLVDGRLREPLRSHWRQVVETIAQQVTMDRPPQTGRGKRSTRT